MFTDKNEIKYVYVVLSRTHSTFAKTIRMVTKMKYNHASIAFDRELEHLYSFGRKQSHVPIVAGIVREYPARFSLEKVSCVNAKIYEIPVTKEQYYKGLARIRQIEEDGTYLYNLFSVLTFPVLHGFETYKAFSCSEFVAHMLNYMNIHLKEVKKGYEYTPEDIGKSITGKSIFEGNLLEYCKNESEDEAYFFQRPEYLRSGMESCSVVARLVYRKFWFAH